MKKIIADCMTPGLERRPKHPVRLGCLLPDLAAVFQQLASATRSFDQQDKSLSDNLRVG